MNLGKHLETKDDKEIAKRFNNKILDVEQHEIYYDPQFKCNCFFINASGYDAENYRKNKRVRTLIDAKLEEMDAWIFVTHISGARNRIKVLKVCWEPATDKKYKNIEDRHVSVSKHGFNKRFYKKVIDRLKNDAWVDVRGIDDHTAKYLESKGLVLRQNNFDCYVQYTYA